jgi:peptidoglycan/LPS O-acetylase OafA/YrhL
MSDTGSTPAPDGSSSPPAGTVIPQAGEIRSARIESLRAIAALAVLVGHVVAESRALGATQTTSTGLPLVERVLFGGGYGVFFFFALTGYLLYWPFARRYYGGGATVELRRYAMNRALRILPLYYAVIFVVLVFGAAVSAGTWIRFLTFTQSFSAATIGTVDGPAWSLVVEVQFYVLLPLLALALARVGGGSARRAALLLGALALISLAFRQHYIYAPDFAPPIWRMNMPTTFLFFVPGMLLAIARVELEGHRPPWLRGGLLRADLWLLATVPLWVLLIGVSYDLDWLLCVAAFLTIGACVLPLRPGPLVRALEWRPLAALGVASYSLYLWHVPVLELLLSHLSAPTSVAGLAAVGVPVAIGVAAVSYLTIERPFLRRRRQWSSASAPSAAAQAPSAAGRVPS